MLRGSTSARIDDKGRLKVPAAFRATVTAQYGDALYVTSLTGQSVLIYPMPVWTALEERLREVPATLPARQRYIDRVSFYGQEAAFDQQGRVSIHGHLREAAEMAGETRVFGQLDHLEVWNQARFEKKLKQEPLTDDDLSALADLGI